MIPAFRFRFIKNKSATLASPSSDHGLGVEVILTSSKVAKAPITKLGLVGTHWKSAEIVTQYERRYLKTKTEAAEGEIQIRRVSFSSGAQAFILFLPGKLKTFALHTQLREALGETLGSLKSGDGPLSLDLHLLDSAEQARALNAFIFLCATAGWEPTQYGDKAKKALAKKSKTEKSEPIRVDIRCSLREALAQSILDRATLLGEANNEVRTLADLPANELTPGTYRAHVQELAKLHGLKYEFLDRKELTARKAGAFLAVTRADPNTEGGIAHLSYIPKKRSKNAKVLSLVGKGICFDTGGYNIKGGTYMLGMHGDMTGSAVALALISYFAQRKVDFEIHAYLALAENLISATAYKPNEVVIASDGTSIEVVDTDAEGRMVLADTLAIARLGKPDLLIDFATLTGAAVRALDTKKSAVFSHDDRLTKLAVQCGDAVGERLWSFPLDEDYKKGLKSKIADFLQCSTSNSADHIYAATFLSHFAGKETPWVHVDLASCENKGGLGLISSDTTGFGVVWADRFIESFFGKSI